MSEFITFKRTALLVLMFVAAWCLPMKGEQTVNGYTLYGLGGEDYSNPWDSQKRGECQINLPSPMESLNNFNVEFKLDDPSLADVFKLRAQGNESDETGVLRFQTQRQDDSIHKFDYSISWTPGDESRGKVCAYTISLYSPQNTTEPLVVFTGKISIVNTPGIRLPNRVAGEIGADIPFSITLEPNDLTDLQNTTIRFTKIDGITLKGDNLQAEGEQWILPVRTMAEPTTYSLTLQTDREMKNQYLPVYLYKKDGTDISPCRTHLRISVPFKVSDKDMAGLQKIADDNQNAYFLEYMQQQKYLADDDSIQVDWDDSDPEARLAAMTLNFKNLTTVDVSAFDALEHLSINGAGITSLDLSGLDKLSFVNLSNTGIIDPNTIQWPANSSDLNIHGWVDLPIGKEIGNRRYQLTSVEKVDLSQYISPGASATVKWFDTYNNEIEWEEETPGSHVFIVPVATDKNDTYLCEISYEGYPDWTVQSAGRIQIVRGAIEYSENDIQLLKNLAAANPDCHELQQFVADSVQGWKEEWDSGWNDRPWLAEDRKVAVDWNHETPARISKLRIRNAKKISSLDLSGFTELIHLNASGLQEWDEVQRKYIGLEVLDLTKNKKLKKIEIESNSILQSLNLSGLAGLEHVSISGNFKLSSIDLSASQNVLSYLDVTSCDLLQLDLRQFTALQYLYAPGTTQFADYVAAPPAHLVGLFYNGTEYPALDLSKYPNLEEYGPPSHVEVLDVTKTNIKKLDLSETRVRYSTLKAGEHVNLLSGRSQITIPGLKELEEGVQKDRPVYEIAVGDTVDLSSEAKIGSIVSQYIWVDEHDRTEANGVFIPVNNEPGKFVYNGGGRQDGYYHCLIGNERYSHTFTINTQGGWALGTFSIKIPGIQATYAPAEVASLKAIVDNTDSPALRQWWESGAWKKNEGQNQGGRFQVWWMLDESTHVYHVEALQLIGLEDTLTTLDVSAFTEMVSLDCQNNGLEELSVASNNKLQTLQVNSCPNLTSLVLPEVKTSLQDLYCLYNNALQTLNVEDYTNLRTLNLRDCESLESVGDLSRLVNLEYLWLNSTTLPLVTDNDNYPQMKSLGVPRTTTQINLTRMPLLERLDVSNSMLKYSTVTLEKGKKYEITGTTRMKDIPGLSRLAPEYAEFWPFHLIPADATFNVGQEFEKFNNVRASGTARKYNSAESSRSVSIVDKLEDMKSYVIEGGKIHDNVEIFFSNTDYPGWQMVLEGQIVSCDGDANLDTKVDVRDLVVTANYIVKNADALTDDQFGKYEADVNHDNTVDAADMQGIVNLILNRKVTKSTDGLRSGYLPTVELSVENGILYMESEVAVAALQLELTGMMQAEPLLGKAAAFTQLANVGDTTRILGYSMKNVTVPAGKSALMKFPAGARLAKAVFSDEKAQSLNIRTKGDIATSNEAIHLPAAGEINNYPNPFSGTTTIVYHIDAPADKAFIEVYSFSGALVDIIGGLDTQAGENRVSYSTRLTAGTYIYRLATQRQGRTTYSKSNTFIIK